MRSRASFRGHPIHPALIPFPLAFLVGGALFDLVGVMLDRVDLWSTGRWLVLAGIAMALVAAVPGLIDYLKTVPPKSSGKRRATKHMIVNLSAVALFAIASIVRGGADAEPGVFVLALELLALPLLAAGGWMGGVLVNRNQIGVDHRYAGAGKWQEQRIDGEAGEWRAVARVDELEINQMKLLHVNDGRIVLARTEEGWVAFDDHCTHRGGSLADGALICGTVQCPWHGSQFDVSNGRVTAGPAEKGITVHATRVADGVVRLEMPAPRGRRLDIA